MRPRPRGQFLGCAESATLTTCPAPTGQACVAPCGSPLLPPWLPSFSSPGDLSPGEHHPCPLRWPPLSGGWRQGLGEAGAPLCGSQAHTGLPAPLGPSLTHRPGLAAASCCAPPGRVLSGSAVPCSAPAVSAECQGATTCQLWRLGVRHQGLGLLSFLLGWTTCLLAEACPDAGGWSRWEVGDGWDPRSLASTHIKAS